MAQVVRTGQVRSGDRWCQVAQVVRTGGVRWSGGGVTRETVSVGVPSALLARPYAKSVPNQVKNR